MFVLYCRKRDCIKKPGSFLEFYVGLSCNGLTFPFEPIKRFVGRELQTYNLQCGIYTCTLITVKSEAPTRPQKRTLESIKDGIWITYMDTVPKGHYKDQAVGRSTYFSVQIDPTIQHVLESGYAQIYAAIEAEWPDCSKKNEPYVVYHGTAKSSVASIFEEGLKPSFGMLGTAIYFGSFWKAFRFSTLTQDYKPRHGAILRCFVFCVLPYVRSDSSRGCACKKCGSKIGIEDHMGLWQKMSNFVMCLPGKTIKNEEYATPDFSNCLIESVAYAKCQTEHHEPFNRTLQIE